MVQLDWSNFVIRISVPALGALVVSVVIILVAVRLIRLGRAAQSPVDGTPQDADDVGNAEAAVSEAQAKILLEQISEYTKLARASWLTLISLCVYSWIAVFSLTDEQVFKNDFSLELPIIGTAIRPIGFFVAAPILILALHLYVQVTLVAIWRYTSLLPRRVDGFVRRDRVQPWIGVALLRHDTRVSEFDRLATVVAVFLVWVLPQKLWKQTLHVELR